MSLLRWNSVKIGKKIMIGTLLSIVPMLMIIFATSSIQKQASIGNSEAIARLITKNYSQSINNEISLLANNFQGWTREDIYGMAIEYQAISELKNDFIHKLQAAPAFNSLFLADLTGKILVAASNGIDLEGKSFEQAADLAARQGNSVSLVNNTFLKGKEEKTFLFSFATHDSAGKTNGLLLAFVDGAIFQTTIKKIQEELLTSGFPDASSLILDTADGGALFHSKSEIAGTKFADGEFLQRVKMGNDLVMEMVGKEFLTHAPITDDAAVYQKGAKAINNSKLNLVVVIPEADIFDKLRRVYIVSAVIAAIGVFLVVLIALVIARTITGPLKETVAIVNTIADGDLTWKPMHERKDEIGEVLSAINLMCDRMSDAVGRSFTVSRALADGSAVQVASLEETASSLEEISAMTRNNADNCYQANSLMGETITVIRNAAGSMKDLTTSMQQISAASEQTQKIVKTIDEISFQTNLLALNAAVEAARAGEAGAGFAVVADEVRNLAKRAAVASKDTAELIANTVQKINAGADLVQKTGIGFEQVNNGSAKVGELLAEISKGSNEQAQGIQQINMTMSEIDRVTQDNNHNAEELALSMAVFKISESSDFSPVDQGKRPLLEA